MKKTLYKLWSKFLTMFGNIKIFKWPLFLVYDPEFFKINGSKIQQIIDILKPGDVILRGYDDYADGKLVPGKLCFSHAGLFIGKDTVIHAIAKGVSKENIIDFCLCDRIAIFRPNKYTKQAIKFAKKLLNENTEYDFGFQRGINSVYCFELCAEAYQKLNIPRYTISKLFGLINKRDVFLAESFFESDDFKCILHCNPKFKIDEVF